MAYDLWRKAEILCPLSLERLLFTRNSQYLAGSSR